MDFSKKTEQIIKKDPRYKPDAYEFIMQALWFTQETLKRKGHVTGRELVEGIRGFGISQYGPMTKAVLEHWGVKTTGDFGEIVFNMIEEGMLGKTDEDSREDFKNLYDFNEAFDVKDNFKLEK